MSSTCQFEPNGETYPLQQAHEDHREESADDTLEDIEEDGEDGFEDDRQDGVEGSLEENDREGTSLGEGCESQDNMSVDGELDEDDRDVDEDDEDDVVSDKEWDADFKAANDGLEDFFTEILADTEQTRVSAFLERCDLNCSSSVRENRCTGANFLIAEWAKEGHQWSDYHVAKCFYLICKHAHGKARAEFKKLGVSGVRAGIFCISLCRSVKMVGELSTEAFQPFADLASGVAKTIAQGRTKLLAAVREFGEQRWDAIDFQPVPGFVGYEDEEDKEGVPNTHAEDDEEMTDRAVRDLADEADKATLLPGRITCVIINTEDGVPELNIGGYDEDAADGKSLLMLMQSHKHTIACHDLLTGYLENQEIRRLKTLLGREVYCGTDSEYDGQEDEDSTTDSSALDTGCGDDKGSNDGSFHDTDEHLPREEADLLHESDPHASSAEERRIEMVAHPKQEPGPRSLETPGRRRKRHVHFESDLDDAEEASALPLRPSKKQKDLSKAD